MVQVANFPTKKQNALDLLITTRPSFIDNYSFINWFWRPGQCNPIWSNLSLTFYKPIKRKIHNWKRANLKELRKNVKEKMGKFVRGNTINTPIIYGSN